MFTHIAEATMASSRQAAPRTTTASGARRNLFSHALSRRPTASSTSGTSATTLQAAATPEENSDIIARDEHGNYQIDETPQMPMPKSEEQEERGMHTSPHLF